MLHSHLTTLVMGTVLVGSASCSGEENVGRDAPHTPAPAPETRTPASDELEALYARDHLVEVAIELAPADWQALRAEGRAVIDGFAGADDDFAYTEYVGTATVDGQKYENVVVRKKGYLGSLSRVRPSLKLDFGEVEDGVGRPFERLTLNNNRGEYSRARTCLAYDVFARAGVPAPRCNLAHVVVNGEDLGTYSNVEPIKKPMLERHFGDASGVLYEGQLVDFVESDLPRFQLKTSDTGESRKALQALENALRASDAELPARLEEVIDLARFRDFWAAETLVGHWDGYSGNRNNFYLYGNPVTGRLEFIPWGTDGAFAESIPGDAVNHGKNVYARGVLAKRLYALPAERAHFRSRLGALNDLAWDEEVLTRELERITALAPDALPKATAALAQHLETHGDSVREELQKKGRDWIDNPESTCAGMTSQLRFGFSTNYGDLQTLKPAVGGFDADLHLDAASVGIPPNTWRARAGVADPTANPAITIRAAASLGNGVGILLELSMPAEEFSVGQRALHGFETAGLVGILDGDRVRFVGFITDGTLQLDSASTVAGMPVSGRVDGTLMQLYCADLE